MTYGYFGDKAERMIEEEQLFNQAFREPSEDALLQFIVLVMSLAWYVALPTLIIIAMIREKKH